MDFDIEMIRHWRWYRLWKRVIEVEGTASSHKMKSEIDLSLKWFEVAVCMYVAHQII